MYEIEKGIGIPRMHRKRSEEHPFDIMDIGDSFLVQSLDKERAKVMNRLTSLAQHRKPKKFATRSVDGGIRVWRIA